MRLKRQLLRVSPGLDDPKFAPVVTSYVKVTLLASNAYEFLRSNDIAGANGELRASLTTFRQLVETQFKLATALGLTPASAAPLADRRPILDLASIRNVTDDDEENDEN